MRRRRAAAPVDPLMRVKVIVESLTPDSRNQERYEALLSELKAVVKAEEVWLRSISSCDESPSHSSCWKPHRANAYLRWIVTHSHCQFIPKYSIGTAQA